MVNNNISARQEITKSLYNTTQLGIETTVDAARRLRGQCGRLLRGIWRWDRSRILGRGRLREADCAF
jgi:hypothetical protein